MPLTLLTSTTRRGLRLPIRERTSTAPLTVTRSQKRSLARSAGSCDPPSRHFEKLPRERPPSAVREPDSAFASDQPAAGGGGGPADPRLDVGQCVCGRAAQRSAQGPAFLLPLQRMISFPPSLFMHDFSVFRVRLGKRAARRTPQRQTVTECWYTSYDLLRLARGRRRLRITRVHCVPGLRLENMLPALRPRPPRQG